jgi:mannosyltransferase
MLPGIALKWLLGKRLRLLFTSAAQRRHSGYTRWLLRRMDAIIATSGKSASYLDMPATVIRHGIDADQFRPVAEKAALRRRLGLPEHALLIGCYGRIRPQKGNDIFVDALLETLPRHPQACGIIMGGVTEPFRPFVEDLRDRIAAAGLADRLLILPEAPNWEITAYFQALDLYVAPQRWEGFGLTPLEAMACGVPVVATRVGAFEELIADGETGILVEVEDRAAIAAALDRLLSDADLRQDWAIAGRARVEAQFRLEGEAEAIVAVYRDLLRRGS